MARYVDTIDLPINLEDAFEYLACFENTRDWDPGVVEAERLDSGELRVGSSFRVVAIFLGSDVELTYEITQLERPHRVVLEARNDRVHSVDEISFSPRGSGTRVTYEAVLELQGLAKLADPLLGLIFGFVGRNAVNGLKQTVVHMPRRAA